MSRKVKQVIPASKRESGEFEELSLSYGIEGEMSDSER